MAKMNEAIKIENLYKNFGTLEVLKNVNMSVKEGETVVLLGSSGSGKSTLLRCINYMEEPTDGRISFYGEPIGKRKGDKTTYKESDLCKLRTRIGMVFQHFNLFPHMTVLQNVIEGPRAVLNCSFVEAKERAFSQLERVGLAHKAEEYPARLSGGQKQRVAIARSLAMEPKVMLFDEVTSALDPELVGEVLKTMRQLAEEGMTMISVTHELGFAYHIANRVLFLDGGKIIEEGNPQEILKDPRTTRMKEFLEGHSLFKMPV